MQNFTYHTPTKVFFGKDTHKQIGQIVAGYPESQEELIRGMEEVTLERILAAAKTITPDTVYFLKGREATQ